MAAKRHVEVVMPKLCDIDFNVITHCHMMFNAEFISKVVVIFKVAVKKNPGWPPFDV